MADTLSASFSCLASCGVGQNNDQTNFYRSAPIATNSFHARSNHLDLIECPPEWVQNSKTLPLAFSCLAQFRSPSELLVD